MEARKQWNISKVKKKGQPEILYSRKIFSKSEDEIKTTAEKQKLREYITSRLPFKEKLKA